MSIELQPLGVACNLKCTYCYQNPMRDAGNTRLAGYDLQAMFDAAVAEGAGSKWTDRDGQERTTAVTVFGGEPLLIPVRDLEVVFEWAAGKKIPIGIQTNGTLVTPRHLELFAKYQVSVGVSMDGPDELNDSRWAGTEALTRGETAKSQRTIEALCDAGRPPSIIVTLYRGNASTDRLPRLLGWVRDLHARGVRWFNFHALEVDHELVEAQRLTDGEELAAMHALLALQAELPGAHFAPWEDMRNLLLGDDSSTSCIWNACDPYLTDAVRGVDGAGGRANCGRTNKDGVVWRKIETRGHERQLALYLTPQEDGGCAGCRFFFACKGECPGTAERGDWRARTDHCAKLKDQFGAVEARLVAEGKEPLSLSLRRPLVEARLLAAWATGQNATIASALSGPDAHGNQPHQDTPHQDHNDVAAQIAVIKDCGQTNHHDGPCARCGYGTREEYTV